MLRRRYPWLTTADLAVLAELEAIDPEMAREFERLLDRQGYVESKIRDHETTEVDPAEVADARHGRARAGPGGGRKRTIPPPTKTSRSTPMAPTTPTTALAPDPSCMACGVDDPCSFHAGDMDDASLPGLSEADHQAYRTLHSGRALESRRGIADDHELAAMSAARRDLARTLDLEPVATPAPPRQAAPEPRSIEKDMGLDDDALVPVAKLRERDAIVLRWKALDRAPVTAQSTAEFIASLHDLARLGEPA
jgi:hypothetical protein